MKIINYYLRKKTKGAGDLINITGEIAGIIGGSGLSTGSVTIFNIGSTAGITTFEYEGGMIKDMQELYEKLVPSTRHYHHDDTWGDANGFSHLRAALQGPNLTVPFENGEMVLGTWQQIVLAEFDNRPRDRRVAVQLIGE